MTYPGYPGQPGPTFISNAAGYQKRQVRAGAYPPDRSTVLDALANPPATGITAENKTVMQMRAQSPFPIEAQNFELNFDQYNNPPGTGSADPGYTGE
jgi:hypothetical protein